MTLHVHIGYTPRLRYLRFILPRGTGHRAKGIINAKYTLDHSCNKYCNLIGYRQVSISHSHLQASHSHLQSLPPGSSNTRLYDLNLLDTV